MERIKLRKDHRDLYRHLLRYDRKLLDRLFPSTRTFYTYELIKLDASKYKTLKDWYTFGKNSYSAAVRLGLVGEFSKNMCVKWVRKWTASTVKLEASKYDSAKEWRKNSPSSYGSAIKLGILAEVNKSFKNKVTPYGHWTKENILTDASKYKTKKSWKKYSTAYCASLKLGLTNEINNIFNISTKPPGYWKKETILKNAQKYRTKTELHKDRKLYAAILRNGLMNECCKHMTNGGIRSSKRIIDLNTGKLFESAKFASRYYLISIGHIRNCIKLNKKTYKGNKFEYFDETKHKGFIQK